MILPKFNEAKDHYERALKIFEQVHGIDSHQHADTLNNLGVLHQDQRIMESLLKAKLISSKYWQGTPNLEQIKDSGQLHDRLVQLWTQADSQVDVEQVQVERIADRLWAHRQWLHHHRNAESFNERERNAFYSKYQVISLLDVEWRDDGEEVESR